MTVKSSNRDAIAHGKINVEPLREQPKYPSWALKPVSYTHLTLPTTPYV